mmetsp:Transcript_58380/g.142775  ORF Transcript_58380/g.142775 Transcript_58380/m.142775 type:complete len:213 (+) Transcript_58380:204-842(+)
MYSYPRKKTMVRSNDRSIHPTVTGSILHLSSPSHHGTSIKFIYNRNSGRFKSNVPGNDGETSSNVPVPGIPIIPPNHPSPNIRFILRKNPIRTARMTVKMLNPSNSFMIIHSDGCPSSISNLVASSKSSRPPPSPTYTFSNTTSSLLLLLLLPLRRIRSFTISRSISSSLSPIFASSMMRRRSQYPFFFFFFLLLLFLIHVFFFTLLAVVVV